MAWNGIGRIISYLLLVLSSVISKPPWQLLLRTVTRMVSTNVWTHKVTQRTHRFCSPFINTLRPAKMAAISQTFAKVFLEWITISQKCIPKCPNIPALAGVKQLSGLTLASLLTHIFVTRPQVVDILRHEQNGSHFANEILKSVFLKRNRLL